MQFCSYVSILDPKRKPSVVFRYTLRINQAESVRTGSMVAHIRRFIPYDLVYVYQHRKCRAICISVSQFQMKLNIYFIVSCYWGFTLL